MAAGDVQRWFNSAHNEFYYDAFSYDYKAIWRGIDSIYSSKEEIVLRCYYRAMMVWLYSDAESIIDRRKLLFSFLSSEFKTDSVSDTLVRMRKVLPTHTSVNRILSRLCTAYDDEPQRQFSDDEATQNYLTELYSAMRMGTAMNDLYQRARYTGLIAARPMLTGLGWRLEVLTPDEFSYTTNVDNPEEITSITIPRVADNAIEYEVWTNDLRIVYDGNGKQISDEENRYGEIPYKFLSMSRGGMWNLVEGQLGDNKLKFLADLSVTYTGSPVWIAQNMGDNIVISPDRVIKIDNVRSGEGMLDAPSLEALSPEATYQTVEDFAALRMRRLQMEEGIPASMLTDSGEPPSGISRIIERQELVELRNADQKKLREYERELCGFIALVARVDAGATIAEPALQITYSDEIVYMNPADEYALDKIKVADGVLSVAAFYNKWSNIDGDPMEIVAERREQARQVFGSGDVAAQMAAILN